MSNTAQYQISVTRERDGKDCGRWKQSGGWKTDSEETWTKDEYGLPRTPLGGTRTRDNITATRTFYAGDTLPEQLDEGAGKDMFVLSRQKLDANGHAVGAPITRRAMLKSIELADVNIEGPETDSYTAEWSVES